MMSLQTFFQECKADQMTRYGTHFVGQTLPSKAFYRYSRLIVQSMFDGAVYLALKAGVPIIPVGIGGSERVMPKSAKFIYPRKVRVVIGEALHPNVPTGEGSRVPRSGIAEQSASLHAELQRLFDMSMVGVGWSYPPESSQDQNATKD